jgi:membrane protease YdiL (CAAX protease family)
MLTWLRRHAVISYFVIAYALSWAVWIPMALVGARVYQGQAWPSHIPGLFGPLAAAFIMSAVVAGSAGMRDLLRRMLRWRVVARWYLVAVSPLAFYALAVITLAARGQGWPDLARMGMFSGLPVVSVPVMGLLLLATSYAEETGWRGFAAEELLQTSSLLRAALAIGLLWTLWHVPSVFVIENYRRMGIAIIPMLTLGIVSGSILLAWLYRGSGGSVFLVALWHACYNLVSGTAAAGEVPVAVVSTGVMVWAVVIVVAEVRRGRRENATKSKVTPATI